MKRSHMILIAVAALAVLAVALLIPKHTAHNGKAPAPTEAQAAGELVLGGASVDPLCFITRAPENADAPYPTTGCEDGEFARDPQAEANPFGAGLVSAGYVFKDDGQSYPGMVGYRYLGEMDGHKAVLVVENGGGSGVFSRLMLLDYNAGAKQLKPIKHIASGDRCNGGITGADIVDGKLVYNRDFTPYDMMGLTGDPNRAILQTEAAQQIPSCAVCCYGRAQFAGGTFTSMTFDPALPEAIAGKTYGEDKGVEQCFDEQLTHAMDGGKNYFEPDEFAALAGKIEQTCLAPAEGG